jgi:hypothetical protein
VGPNLKLTCWSFYSGNTKLAKMSSEYVAITNIWIICTKNDIEWLQRRPCWSGCTAGHVGVVATPAMLEWLHRRPCWTWSGCTAGHVGVVAPLAMLEWLHRRPCWTAAGWMPCWMPNNKIYLFREIDMIKCYSHVNIFYCSALQHGRRWRARCECNAVFFFTQGTFFF